MTANMPMSITTFHAAIARLFFRSHLCTNLLKVRVPTFSQDIVGDIVFVVVESEIYDAAALTGEPVNGGRLVHR